MKPRDQLPAPPQPSLKISLKWVMRLKQDYCKKLFSILAYHIREKLSSSFILELRHLTWWTDGAYFIRVVQTGCKLGSNRTPVFSRSNVLFVTIVQILSKACCKSCVRSLSLKWTGLCVCAEQACSLWPLRSDGSKPFIAKNSGFFTLNTFRIFALTVYATGSFPALSLAQIRKQTMPLSGVKYSH